MASALEPLVGRWATTIEMLHPEEAAGTGYHATDTYRWMTGEAVLVHEVHARMGEDTVESLEVYTADGDGFVSRNFDARGQVSDYRATMTDGVWKVVGETERFTSDSIGDEQITGLWELKTDEGWVEWMRVTLDRVG